MKNLLFLILAASLLFACEKTALNTTSGSVNRAVVESFLQPGVIPVVHVKKQLAYGSTDSVQEAILGLNVVLEDVASGQTYSLVHTDSSAYAADGSWQIEAGKTYRLSFDYDNQPVGAETVVPAKPVDFAASASSIKGFSFGNFTPGSTPPSFPDPIELTWDASDGGYYLVVVQTVSDDAELINTDTSNFRPFRAFRSEPQQTNTFQIQAMSFRYYGTHYVILYHLNAEYAALYEDSGNNSTNLSTPFTNINGGLGILTGINADTLLVEVNK